MNETSPVQVNRRRWLQATASGVIGSGLLTSLEAGAFSSARCEETAAHALGRAKHCIFLWLGGGACHIDTFDPKRLGDPKQGAKQPGSHYSAIATAIPGVQVCEHLPHLADRLDRGSIIRSLNHDVIDEHAAATNRMHVGRPPTGTTVYPSIGSVVAQQLGAEGEGVPPYVVMGYPSATRGPGFLGSQFGYIYLTDTAAGPAGLQRPADISAARMQRRNELLQRQISRIQQQAGDDSVLSQYGETSLQAMRLAGPDFMPVFDLKSENAQLRENYGEEFGQRCLLARRLVESGVRFVEVSFNLNFINGTGWDTHNEGQENQHLLIQQLDQAVSTLVDDLDRVGHLDDTLVVIATEFGRPPEFDGGGGRGHQSRAFSAVLLGGGLKSGQVIGTTDELGRKVIDRPVSVPDFHATIYASMGIDPNHELYDGDRPVPLTDQGIPLRELFVG
jgi:hypothetical protein